MYSHLEPRESYPEPTRMPSPSPHGEPFLGLVEEWRYDTDGTRYRAIVVWTPYTARVLVAIEWDAQGKRAWWALDWKPGDHLSDGYIAEKWNLRHGDDLTNVARLIRAALQREE